MIHRSIILICPVCNSTHYWACFPHQNKRIFRNSFFRTHDWYVSCFCSVFAFSRSLRCISKSLHVFSCLQLIFTTVFADSWLFDSCKKILVNLDWITPFRLFTSLLNFPFVEDIQDEGFWLRALLFVDHRHF